MIKNDKNVQNRKSLHPHESMPFWMAELSAPTFPTLGEDFETDVCIVGAGLGGLTAAYFLLKEGKKVCVLEAYELGSGQTCRTTAQFVTSLDERYFQLEKYHGKEGARLAAESHSAALKKVEEIVLLEKIECDFKKVDGFLFAGSEKHLPELDLELRAAKSSGLQDVHRIPRSPLTFFDTGPALCFPNQIQLHPLKYLYGLAECILEKGGKIFTHTHVESMQGGNSPSVKTRDGFSVKAPSIIVATHSPINNMFAIHSKQAPYRSYVIAAPVPKGSVPYGLYWDTADPFHYVRLHKSSHSDQEYLIVGGEDHKTGQNDDPIDSYRRLEEWTVQRFPMVKKFIYHWSGQVMESVDGLAYLGRNPHDKNIYVITGDCGNGMTHCTIGGILVTDQIMGRENPWEQLYDPSRINIRSAGEFVRENINVAVQFKDWFGGEDLEKLNDISTGEGCIVKKGLNKIAAYKNNLGNFELLSAICPHLGCIVAWNTAEKSWDCPCHGSRFDCQGKVIVGPATVDLNNI
jgi:glycine/D-amino acid oxidase-like deaminating enzyme/nitrite reductase/ring-hydroxylating ferredoxin subunit